MSKKNSKMLPEKRSKLILAAKIMAILLSLYFSGAMTALSGAGLIYNRESYGTELRNIGIFLLISAALMVSGAFLCLLRKKIANILSAVFSSAGLVLCLVMLKQLTDHADLRGWTDKYTMLPVSDMYMRRIMPCIIPAALTVIIAAVQLRSEHRSKKAAEDNAAAPPIV